ncbi:MAG: hypothetical protein ABL973_14250 [Micropepsaceae bacterium]
MSKTEIDISPRSGPAILATHDLCLVVDKKLSEFLEAYAEFGRFAHNELAPGWSSVRGKIEKFRAMVPDLRRQIQTVSVRASSIEIGKAIVLLAAAYPSLSGKNLDAWARLMRMDIAALRPTLHRLETAMRRVRHHCKFPPSIAEVIEQFSTVATIELNLRKIDGLEDELIEFDKRQSRRSQEKRRQLQHDWAIDFVPDDFVQEVEKCRRQITNGESLYGMTPAAIAKACELEGVATDEVNMSE